MENLGENVVQQLMTEDVITFVQAGKELPGRPHRSTLWRWHNRGLGGVKLEAFRLGRVWYTSRQSLTRFIEATQGVEAV